MHCKSWPRLQKKGVDNAVEIVASRLQDSSQEVRLAALQAFVAVADKDDSKAIKGVWTCAEARVEEVQLAAVEALMELQMFKRGSTTVLGVAKVDTQDTCQEQVLTELLQFCSWFGSLGCLCGHCVLHWCWSW